MRRSSALAAAALALVAAGCGKDACPTESPEVRKVGACTASPGQSVPFPITLCPTCNQMLTACDAQISGTNIFLDPRVEACTNSSSCGAGCNLNASTCTFTAPAATQSYTVQAYDAAHPNTPRVGTLDVVASTALNCTP